MRGCLEDNNSRVQRIEMSFENILNHPLLVWEWLLLSIGFTCVKIAFRIVWNKGKKKGVTEYDEYKKWEKVFKDKENKKYES